MDKRKDVADLIADSLHQATPKIVERATSVSQQPLFSAAQLQWFQEQLQLVRQQAVQDALVRFRQMDARGR